MRRVIRPGESVSEVLVRAVADLTGQDPDEMPPIAESIDADALDALFVRSSGDGPETLTLLYEGCRVTVDSEAVTVVPVPAASGFRTSGRSHEASETATPDPLDGSGPDEGAER